MKTLEVIDRLDAATQELAMANRLAMALLREMEAARGESEAWRRFPANGQRCPVSNWSRSTIWNYIQENKIGSKLVKGCRFYCLNDVRKLISDS